MEATEYEFLAENEKITILAKFTHPTMTLIQVKFTHSTMTLIQVKFPYPTMTLIQVKFPYPTMTLIQVKFTHPTMTCKQVKFIHPTVTFINYTGKVNSSNSMTMVRETGALSSKGLITH